MSNTEDFIFLTSGESNKLIKAPNTPYALEQDLQTLVAEHPELLLVGDTSEEGVLRWMLVAPEAGIPDAESGGDRWWIDHMFLDQKGTPTFVEVKRATDTRIRREVVGQMLEYAANALRYWPAGKLRALAEERSGDNANSRLIELLDLNPAALETDRIEAFWQTVDENIREGRVRLLFVADELPKELRATIEFMNEKMETVEVLGVELRQYAGEGVRALVPRIIGQTEATRIAKRKPSALRPRLNEVTFPKVCPALALECFTDALREAGKRGLSVKWATQSFGLGLPLGRGYATLLTAWVDREPAMVQCYVQGVGDKQMRQEVRQRFLDLGRFRSSGEYTAELQLTDLEAVEVTRKALEIVWEIAAELGATQATLEEGQSAST